MYLVPNDLDKANDFLAWFNNEFTDDAGEPIQMFCWALLPHRMGQNNEAKRKLAEAMLTKLYLIPNILGEKIQEYDMWHSSNFTEIDYIDELPHEVRSAISESEGHWLGERYESFEFRRIRKRYVEIYHALKLEKKFDSRSKLVAESQELLNIIQ